MNVERLFYCHLCKYTSNIVAHWLRRSFALIAHLGRQSGLASRSSYFWDCASSAEYQWRDNHLKFLGKNPELPGIFFPEDHQHTGCNQHGETSEISGDGGFLFLVTGSGNRLIKSCLNSWLCPCSRPMRRFWDLQKVLQVIWKQERGKLCCQGHWF